MRYLISPFVGQATVRSKQFHSSQWSYSPVQQPTTLSTKVTTPKSHDESSAAKPSVSKRNDSKPSWLIQKDALRRKFTQGWNPPKKISRPSMALLRTLHKTNPEQFSLPVLAEKFKISPEAVRRILRSKWDPKTVTEQRVQSSQDQQSGVNSSNQYSSDGWVHHERQQTDQIPVNLAHALQSSVHSNKGKQFKFLKTEATVLRENDSGEVITIKKSSRRSDSCENSQLGSAFPQRTFFKNSH